MNFSSTKPVLSLPEGLYGSDVITYMKRKMKKTHRNVRNYLVTIKAVITQFSAKQ
jgi:hypothetical protein